MKFKTSTYIILGILAILAIFALLFPFIMFGKA